jgi:hypothetical protein
MAKHLAENDVLSVKLNVAEFSKWKHLNTLQFIVMETATFAYVYQNYPILS